MNWIERTRKKITWFVAIVFYFLSNTLLAQEVLIKGKVYDESGESLVGATVLEAGTTNGVKTGLEGEFSLEVDFSSVLEVSMVGYKKKTVPIEADKEEMKIILQSKVVEGKEVVVTALGITREERSIGFAAQTVSSEKLNKANAPSLIGGLSGKIAGVRIAQSSAVAGGSARIQLRGATSITGNNSPLFIVDGTPINNQDFNTNFTATGGDDLQGLGGGGTDYGNMAQDLNPNDIESITVLRGPSASALYGARAANGVIIIKTKRAKMAKGEKAYLGVSVNTGIEFSSATYHPKLQRQYGGGSSDSFTEATINGQTYSVVDYGTDESWGPKFEGQQVLHWDAFDSEFSEDYLKTRPWVASPNDVPSFFETGITTRNTIAFEGATKDIAARFAYTNDYTKSIFPNSHIMRHTARLNSDFSLGKIFDGSISASYIQTEGFNRPSLGYDRNGNSVAQNFYQWGQRQLNYERMKKYKTTADGRQRTWNRNSWDDRNPHYSDNPYWTAYENYSNDKRDRFLGNGSITANFTDFLKFRLRIGVDAFTMRKQERIAIFSQSQSRYSEELRTAGEYNYEAMLLFNKSFDDFSLSANFGFNHRYNEEFLNFNRTQSGLAVAGYYSLANSKGSLQFIDETRRRVINSVFGNASLGYMDALFLEVTARNDWSSTLPLSNNSYFYPSFNLSVVLSELLSRWNVDADWLTYAKVRGSIALVGNDTDPYQLINTYSAEPVFNSNTAYSYTSRNKAPDLKPELSFNWELGLDMRFFDSRFGFDITYFNTKTSNQIVNAEVPAASGFYESVLNLGEIQNWGVELSAFVNPIRFQAFNWDLSVQWTTVKNTILSFGRDDIESYRLGSLFKAYVEGRKNASFPSIVSFDVERDAQGNRVVDKNGRYISKSTLSVLGSVVPEWNMGITNTFSFIIPSGGRLVLNVVLDIQQGGSFFSVSRQWGMYSGMLEQTAANGIRENGIVLEGRAARYNENGGFVRDANGFIETGEANTTSIIAKRYGQDQYITSPGDNILDASYVKLREITLSYTMPDYWFIDSPINSVSINIYGRNIATFAPTLSEYGFDPEFTFGSGNTQGVDGGMLPSTSTYGIAVSIKF